MSESKTNTPDVGDTNTPSNDNADQNKSNNNKNTTTYNPHNKGSKTHRTYNEHQSLQYEGKTPDIGGVLALRNENFSKKVPLTTTESSVVTT